MSSSKKKRFEECRNCFCLILQKDSEKHRNLCSMEKPLPSRLPTRMSKDNAHAFLLTYGNEVTKLYTFVEVVGSLDDVPAKPVWAKQNTVLLHSAIMEKMGLRPRMPCLVLVGGRSYTKVVWPNDKIIPMMRMGASSAFGWRHGSLAILHPICQKETPRCTTVSLILSPDCMWKSFFEDSTFKQFLTQYFSEAYVNVEDQLEVTYFGQSFQFDISGWEANGKTHQLSLPIMQRSFSDDDAVTRAAESLEKLDLTSPTVSFTDMNHSSDSLRRSSFVTPFSTPKTSLPSSRNMSIVSFPDASFPAVFAMPNVIFLTTETKYTIASSSDGEPESVVRLADVGGLENAKNLLDRYLLAHLRRGGKCDCIGPLLLAGPSGVGKSLLLKALQGELQDCDLNVVWSTGSELFSTYYSSGESAIQKLFSMVQSYDRGVLLIDDLDVLFMKEESEASIKVVSLLCKFMDDANRVAIVGVIRNVDVLSQAMRRRFILEIPAEVPSMTERQQTLNIILKRFNRENEVSEEKLADIASTTHGFTGADLLSIFKLAASCSTNTEETFAENLHSSAKKVRPSAMRELILEVPNVRWSDVAGQEDLKTQLRLLLKHRDKFQSIGIQSPKGILLYGPPGCSKTMVARAIATESGLNFLAVKGPELFNKWVGESERAVRELFRRARQVEPAVIFFDEIDALTVARGSAEKSGGNDVGDRVLAQMLTEMDGLEEQRTVTVVAATNRPDVIDRALLRPGRFDLAFYVSLPDKITRETIYKLQFDKHPSMPIAADVNVEELVDRTSDYSGAEVVGVCQQAGFAALRRNLDAKFVTVDDFEEALSVVRPRTDQKMIEIYENFKAGARK